MKQLLIVLLVCINTIYAANSFYPQEESNGQINSELIYLETHVIPNDSLMNVYISYKISFENLVFVKQGNEYKAGLSLYVDLYRDEIVVSRGSTQKNVTVEDYDKTNSSSDYLQGIINLNVPKDNYKVIPTLSIDNTQRTIVLKEFNILHEREYDDEFIRPIVAEMLSEECWENSAYQLSNTKNYIPFSPHDYDLIIPVMDQSVSTVDVKIKQDNYVVNYTLDNSVNASSIYFEECNNNVILHTLNGNKSIKLFKLSSVNLKLTEGIAEVTVTVNIEKSKVFSFNVVWIDKPQSLGNAEYAIKMLKGITSEEVIDKLLDSKTEDYYKKLTEFWSKRDPKKNTSFNELMAEYYSRVDYANNNYSTKDKLGASMDRGKIFIKLGQPSDIRRVFYDKGNVVEIWHYDKLAKDFYFSDTSGLGNFSLMN